MRLLRKSCRLGTVIYVVFEPIIIVENKSEISQCRRRVPLLVIEVRFWSGRKKDHKTIFGGSNYDFLKSVEAPSPVAKVPVL